MKKLFILPFLFVLFSVCFLNFKSSTVFADNVEIKIIVNQCAIYQNPNIESSTYQITIPHKTVLQAEIYNEEFYFITYQSTSGYILKTNTMLNSNSSPTKKLVFNAVITKDSTIYKLKNNVFEDTFFDKLKKDTKIKLIDGYDTTNDYTLVSFYNQDNEVVSYYIETKNIQPFGVKKSVYVAISLIIFSISIFFILFGTKIKKQKI